MFYSNSLLYGYQQNQQYLRQLMSRTRKKVYHQQTCPKCGRKLVNIYHGFVIENRGTIRETTKEAWKCKKCWDEEGQIDES